MLLLLQFNAHIMADTFCGEFLNDYDNGSKLVSVSLSLPRFPHYVASEFSSQ